MNLFGEENFEVILNFANKDFSLDQSKDINEIYSLIDKTGSEELLDLYDCLKGLYIWIEDQWTNLEDKNRFILTYHRIMSLIIMMKAKIEAVKSSGVPEPAL